jgi:RHS repeat-associated protein
VYGLGLIGQQDSTGYNVYHFDFRGSTVALTNSLGTVTDRFTYGAYGELLTHTGSSDTPFLYNGRDGVLTDTNGLYYMRARFYSPELKRFLNADIKKGSIDNIQTLNLYNFVVGNPIALIDPAGMSADNWWNSTYKSSFTVKSTSELITEAGNDALGISTDLSKELLGRKTKNVNWFVDEEGYIRGLPGEGLEVAKFPKIVGALGKTSSIITYVGGGLDIANTWTENSGNTNGQRVEKTGIQLAGIGASIAGGLLVLH